MSAIRHLSLAAVLRAALVFAPALAVFPALAQSVPDPGEQAAIAKAAEVVYVRELTRMGKERTLNTDATALARVRGATELLLRSAQSLRPESRQWQWAVVVETRAEPVLYCLPGGRIVATTGLLERLRPTPAELTALVAHAIAHALDGHDGDEAAAQFAQRREPADADPNRGMLRLGDLLLKLVLGEPQRPDAERAADTLALQLLAQAGQDPRAAPTAWRKVAAQTGTRPPAFPALHPVDTDRLAAMEAQIPAMVARYEQARQELEKMPAAAPPPGTPARGPQGAPPGSPARR